MSKNPTVLRGAKNFIAQEVAICEPWNFVPKVPADVIGDKGKYTEWRANASTEHLVYFAGEGVNVNVRPSGKTNPFRKLNALVADFDALVSQHDFDTILDRVPADFKPTYIHRTMHSGGCRLIWMFEKQVALESPKLAKAFTKIAYDALRVEKLFAGADLGFHDLLKPWDVGKEWGHLGDNIISANTLEFWLIEAAAKLGRGDLGEINIPLDVIEEEVHRKFPGRWKGSFTLDARGVAFWDPNATNETSAIVKDSGMVCFSTEKGFYSWLDLLGGEFIRKFQSDKIGGATQGIWYDGKGYWWKSGFGTWERYAKEDLTVRLKVRFGIDPRMEAKETSSEIDQALAFIQENRKVTGVFPQVFDPNEIVYSNGKRYLNIATVQPMGYADTPQKWGENFPWLAGFLDKCFAPELVQCASNPHAAPMPAKEIFMCWWKLVYCSALSGCLRKGQAMFLAGPVGAGKTLLSLRIIGASLGGASDASDFLTVSTQFNKELLETGLWCIDDAVASQDPMQHQKFSEMIKRMVANPMIGYRAMYSDAKLVVWNGRIIVTLNMDGSSIRMIPNLDSSLIDKLHVLRLSDVQHDFPEETVLLDTIARELPFLHRWMIDWAPPIQLSEGAGNRFGMNSYIDDLLRVKSLHAGGVSDLMELIDLWLKRSGNHLREKHANQDNQWRGNASEWLSEVSLDDALKPLVSKFTARQLGRKFVEASRIAGSGISVIEGKSNNGNVYCIDLGKRDSSGSAA